jgi:hypothetical protein
MKFTWHRSNETHLERFSWTLKQAREHYMYKRPESNSLGMY